MEEPNNTIFTHAKMEYTNQLIETLTPQFFDGIKSIYDESKIVYKSNPIKGILLYFRIFLEKVPLWSNEIVEVETERIIMMSKCDWLDDLITAVFISHTKILTSIGNNPNSNIDLIIPKTINFIHKCYINIAREIWKNPYLYDDNVGGSDYQKNMRTVELIIKETIENTIRKLLPVKEILKQHLESYENNSNENKKLSSNELRQLLLTELKNIKIENDTKNEEVEKTEEVEDDITNDINNDGYVSPDEEAIRKECDNLDINNIQDITEKYDNPDITINNKIDEDHIDKDAVLKNYIDSIDANSDEGLDNIDRDTIQLTINDTSPSVNNIDTLITKDNINEEQLNMNNESKGKSEPSSPLDSPRNNLEKEELLQKEKKLKLQKEEEQKLENEKEEKLRLEKEKEEELRLEKEKEEKLRLEKEKEEELRLEKEKEEKVEEENKNEGKKLTIIKTNETSTPVDNEIISVTKDISDTETVDDFFNHVSDIMEDKGIKVDKSSKKYTLFDDIIEEDDSFR